MSSNLPPGVTDGMLPGNRPEDVDYELAMDAFWEDDFVLADDSLAAIYESQSALAEEVLAAFYAWLIRTGRLR